MGTTLKNKANHPKDTVIIFFAGHGFSEEDPSVAASDRLAKYLLAHDSDPKNLYGTAFPMEEFGRIFSRIKAQRILFFIDSCFSGQSGGRTISTDLKWRGVSPAFLDDLARGKGRSILASSGPNELSLESSELGHGFFTYYLLKGLKGAADDNDDGYVDLLELTSYVQWQVPKATHNVQTPVFKGETEGSLILGRVAPGYAR